jgi:Uma2 family endonuclease
MHGTVVKVGPADNGRRMSLEEFDKAEAQPGYLYELSKGTIIVSDVPNDRHLAQVDELRQQLYAYRLAQPGRIYRIAGGSDCKILLAEDESERHPDVAVYKHPPADRENLWAKWVPEIVVEIVSADSQHRDYVDKREEYVLFGVRKYWIIDADKQEVLVLRRRGRRWTQHSVRPPKVYTTPLLPGFELNCAAVFASADTVGDS